MKSKIIYLICLALSAMMLFAACEDGAGVGGENNGANSGDSSTCEHPLSDAWESTADIHWNPTTCEHGEHRGNVGEHVDADEDGNCDVCGYVGEHIHTYADEWIFDANNHWKKTTCTHDKIGFFSAHADENSDAECDSCGAHVHVLTTTGMCLGCKEQIKVVDTSNLSGVVASIVDHQINVSGGKITYNFVGRYNNSAQSTKTNKIIDYLYGTGSAYYKIASAAEVKSSDRDGVEYEASTNDLVEKWINLEADDSIYSVYRETIGGVAGNINKDASAADVLSGYYYNVSTLCSGYGAEGVLAALYVRSQELGSSDFVVEENEGNYKFSFNYLAVNSTNTSDGQGNSLGVVTNVNYFVVNVEFDYNSDFTLTSLNITCDCYTSDAGSNLDGDLDLDNVDLEFATQTGKVDIKEGAKADTYTFTVEQTVGERTFVNPYTKADMRPSGFEIYREYEYKNLATDTITISLTNLPEDETSPFVRFFIKSNDASKLLDADDITFSSSDDEGLKYTGFDPVKTRGAFLAKKTGTYTVTITIVDEVRTFTVIVVN